MKRVNLFIVIVGLMIITSLLAACDSSAEPALTASEVPRITAEELKKRLDDGQDILVIDTRIGHKQYELMHVPGAIRNPRSFDDVAHDQAIVAYCTGVHNEEDSARLAARLYGDGFTNVSVLSGGMSAWAETDYPVEGSEAEN
jgi:rhodanese-related sulfurtransferase